VDRVVAPQCQQLRQLTRTMHDGRPDLDQVQVSDQDLETGNRPTQSGGIDPVDPLRLRQRGTRLRVGQP